MAQGGHGAVRWTSQVGEHVLGVRALRLAWRSRRMMETSDQSHLIMGRPPPQPRRALGDDGSAKAEALARDVRSTSY